MRLMPDTPFARATISATRITLNRWMPGLLDGGPGGMVLKGLRRGVVLADLIAGDNEAELIVRFIPRGSATDAARDLLVEWAGTVGWKRLWLDDRVLDLSDVRATIGRAGVSCPTCGVAWHDDRPEFWDQVREDGWFPGCCIACGGSLPEWSASDCMRPSSMSDRALTDTRATDLNHRVR